MKTAIRTAEEMPRADTSKPTYGACHRGIPGIDQGHLALAFNLISGEVEQHAPRPSIKPSVPGMASPLPLAKVKVLKDQDTVLGYPFYQLFRGCVAEVLSAAGLLPLQMFETSGHRFGAPTLYLSGFKPSLQPLNCFPISFIFHSPLETRNEEFPAISIDGNQSISLVEVNTNWYDTLCFWDVNSQSHIANELAIPYLDGDTVYLFSLLKQGLKIFRDAISKVFSTSYCPDRKRSIFSKIGIPAPPANKKQGKGPLESDRAFEPVPVAYRSDISPGHKADSSAGKLAGKFAFNRMINCLMQGQSFKRLAIIPPRRGDIASHPGKGFKGRLEVAVRLYNYLSSPLHFHHQYIATIIRSCQGYSGKEVAHWLGNSCVSSQRKPPGGNLRRGPENTCRCSSKSWIKAVPSISISK